MDKPDPENTGAKVGAATKTGANASPPTGNTNPGRASLPTPLRRMALRFAKEIRDEHGLLDRPTADCLVRLLRTSVVPRRKPGRPTSPEVLKAAHLRESKAPWAKIYSAAIPGFWNLPYLERYWRSSKLRDAVRAHVRRRAKVSSRACPRGAK